MTNAKTEFLEHIEDRKVLCATLIYELSRKEKIYYELKVNYTTDDYRNFLKSIDFDYDNGYGSIELEGTIWYADGSWSERGEYDGSEWWSYKTCPPIPLELKTNEFLLNDFSIMPTNPDGIFNKNE
jgi:hypothetical protein